MSRSKPPKAAGTKAEPLPRPPLPAPGERRWAWFLDVDGTLLELETRPDLVSADIRLLELLKRLNQCYDGAVALISGRSLAQLDRIFGPLRLAAAASHGLELRQTAGGLTQPEDPVVPDSVIEELAAFTERHPGLLMERKSFSVAVHFRGRPELADAVTDRLEKMVAELDNAFRLQQGKMMVELLPTAASKGSAIRTFMQQPPFSGRRPVFVGDDKTDEHGFVAVNELGGLSVRIGEAERTAAQWRLDNVSDLRAWLNAAIETS